MPSALSEGEQTPAMRDTPMCKPGEASHKKLGCATAAVLVVMCFSSIGPQIPQTSIVMHDTLYSFQGMLIDSTCKIWSDGAFSLEMP